MIPAHVYWVNRLIPSLRCNVHEQLFSFCAKKQTKNNKNKSAIQYKRMQSAAIFCSAFSLIFFNYSTYLKTHSSSPPVMSTVNHRAETLHNGSPRRSLPHGRSVGRASRKCQQHAGAFLRNRNRSGQRRQTTKRSRHRVIPQRRVSNISAGR